MAQIIRYKKASYIKLGFGRDSVRLGGCLEKGYCCSLLAEEHFSRYVPRIVGKLLIQFE